MQAYGERTQTGYESWEDLVDHEANRWSVAIVRQKSGRKHSTVTTFARVIGPLASQKLARNKAASVRRQCRRELTDNPVTRLLSVNVEPIWVQW